MQYHKDHLDSIFQHLHRALVAHHDTAILYAKVKYECSPPSLPEKFKDKIRDEFVEEIDKWAQTVLESAWSVCQGERKDPCPAFKSALAQTEELPPRPPPDIIESVLSTIVLVEITSTNHYSAQSRSSLSNFGPIDESLVLELLKHSQNPQKIANVQQVMQETTESHALRSQTLRNMSIGLGAIAGGVIIGVTGGLTAPLVGAGVSTLLGWFGVGGATLGVVSGIAGSSVVCGTLFGVYGARSLSNMVERHTREVRDLELVPIQNRDQDKEKLDNGRGDSSKIPGEDSLAIRLCVSGWLNYAHDVVAPWKMFNTGDTFALQWEVEALQGLSTALARLARSSATQIVRGQIIKQMALGPLLAGLAPLALAQIGTIIDNPWMNCTALAIKTGQVLGDLLFNRAFGNRPVTLMGYSLGSLVIYHALLHLLTKPISSTIHLIQDIYIFGSPIPIDIPVWTSIRRMVAGKIVNGYSNNDYVLAIMCRASEGQWNIAGLKEIDLPGIENLLCEDVEGHTQWRWKVGTILKEREVVPSA